MRSEFEKLLKQHRDALTDELVKLGNYRQAQLVEWDIELNETDYEFYFDGAWQHQQSKIDELQKRVDKALTILSSKKKMYVDMIIEVEQALKGSEESKPSDKNKPA